MSNRGVVERIIREDGAPEAACRLVATKLPELFRDVIDGD
jgi:hypothetical protein